MADVNRFAPTGAKIFQLKSQHQVLDPGNVSKMSYVRTLEEILTKLLDCLAKIKRQNFCFLLQKLQGF